MCKVIVRWGRFCVVSYAQSDGRGGWRWVEGIVGGLSFSFVTIYERLVARAKSASQKRQVDIYANRALGPGKMPAPMG